MPCYNHEKFVEAAIRSVLAQEYENLELLVIDDGSTDKSPEILANLQKELPFTLICRSNKGLITTLNELLSIASGDYICDFASDDMFVQGRIATQVAYLDSHPRVAAVCGLPTWINTNGTVIPGGEKHYYRAKQSITFDEMFCGKAEIHGATEMIRADVLRQFNGWSPHFEIEDLGLWLQILNSGYEIHQINEPLSFYRIHDNNMSSKISFMYGQIQKVLSHFSDHKLYKHASNRWKTHHCSALCRTKKSEAVRMIPKLASATFYFWSHTINLLLPQKR